MNLIKVLPILFIYFTNPSYASLSEACTELNGELRKGFKCPRTSFPLLTPVCFFKNDHGDLHFTDGCTGPSGGHNELFTPSCIKHDLCYHHEPATTGKTQKQCDVEFLENLTSSCEKAENPKKCLKWSKIMFNSVRGFGRLAYNCENLSVLDYLGM